MPVVAVDQDRVVAGWGTPEGPVAALADLLHAAETHRRLQGGSCLVCLVRRVILRGREVDSAAGEPARAGTEALRCDDLPGRTGARLMVKRRRQAFVELIVLLYVLGLGLELALADEGVLLASTQSSSKNIPLDRDVPGIATCVEDPVGIPAELGEGFLALYDDGNVACE